MRQPEDLIRFIEDDINRAIRTAGNITYAAVILENYLLMDAQISPYIR